MAHSFIELDKVVIHVISLVSVIVAFIVSALLDKDKRLLKAA